MKTFILIVLIVSILWHPEGEEIMELYDQHNELFIGHQGRHLLQISSDHWSFRIDDHSALMILPDLLERVCSHT